MKFLLTETLVSSRFHYKKGSSSFDIIEVICDVKNICDTFSPKILLYAWYDTRGVLQNLESVNISQGINKSKSYHFLLRSTNQIENYIVKDFVWDGLNNMSASNQAEISIQMYNALLSEYVAVLDDFYDILQLVMGVHVLSAKQYFTIES